MELNTNTNVTSTDQHVNVSVGVTVNDTETRNPASKPGAKRQAKYREKNEGAGFKQFNRSIPDIPEVREAFDELTQRTRAGALNGTTLQKLVLLSDLDEKQIDLLHDLVVSLKPNVSE